MSIQWPPYSGAQIIMGAEDNSFVKGIEGDGVITGLTLSAAGTDMEVDVASGQAIVGGSLQNNAGGAVALSNGDATNPRFDLIWINSSNTLGKTEGTPVANPVFPDYPANVVILGVAYVQATVTTISTSDLRYRARVELDTSFRHTSDYTKIDASKITGSYSEIDVSSSGRIHAGTYGRPLKFMVPPSAWNSTHYVGGQLEAFYDPRFDNIMINETSLTGFIMCGMPITGILRTYAGNSSNRLRITNITVYFYTTAAVDCRFYLYKRTMSTSSPTQVANPTQSINGFGSVSYTTAFTVDDDTIYWVIPHKASTATAQISVLGGKIEGYEEL